MNMRKLAQTSIAVSLVAMSTGCSWFGGEKEIEPNALVEFEQQAEFKLLWSHSVGSLGDKYRQLSPVLDAKNVYVTDYEGQISAFSKADGKEVWQVNIEEAVSSGVGVGIEHVAVATESGDLLVLNKDSGAQVWRQPIFAEVISAPQFNPELVVVQSINGKLTAFDVETGKRRWVYDAQIPNLTLRGTSSPIVTANITFAGFSNGKVSAIDNASGNEGWAKQVAIPKGRSALERIVDLDGRMLLSDGLLLASSYQGRLAAINPYNAQILWTQAVSSYRGLASGYGNVYLTDTDDGVQAFDLQTSASVWRQPALYYRKAGTPVVVNDYVVVSDQLGYVHAMSQVDGSFTARHQVDSSAIMADMAVSDDVLYVLSQDGRLEALTVQ